MGSLDGARGEVICKGVGVHKNCLTIRDETTLCGLSFIDIRVSSTACAVIKVDGAGLKNVAQRILEAGEAGGVSSQEKLLNASVKFESGVQSIPQPDNQERVTKVGLPFFLSVLAMGALTIMSLTATLALRLLLKSSPVNAPTSSHQMAMSWLNDAGGPGQNGYPKRSADLTLVRDENSKSPEKLRISCADFSDLRQPIGSSQSNVFGASPEV